MKVFWPDGQPVTRSFSKNEVLIGRKSTNDIILAGQDVSGTHACLQVEGGCVTLVDLGSTNGTFVNSERVQVSARLAPADEIKISVFTLHVSVGDEQSAAPPGPGWDPHARATPAPPEPAIPPPPQLRHPPTGAPPISPMPGPAIAPMVGPPVDRRTPVPGRPAAPRMPVGVAPPPVVRGSTAASQSAPHELAPPVHGPSAPSPAASQSDSVAPPVVPPSMPAVADLEPDEAPPTARSPGSPGPATATAARLETDTADLAQVWADPGVRRIVFRGLRPALVERDGVWLSLADGFTSVDELRLRLAALCGRPVLREVPTECLLADGTAVQAMLDGDRGPLVVLTRARPGTLELDRGLPPLAARLLAGCARARLPLLLVARPGAVCAPLLAALAAGVQGATGFVRGLPTPIAAPPGCTAIDAGHGGGHMAAAMRLLLATDAGSLAVDEPEAAALDECAWAHAGGRGVLVGVRAGSLEHALVRARSAGVAGQSAFDPTIPYALAVVLDADRDAGGPFQVARIVELRPGAPGHGIEIFGPDPRGELQAIAAPALLDELARRGEHIAADAFTRA